MKFALIMIIISSAGGRGVALTTVHERFESIVLCERARKAIADNLTAGVPIAQGCHQIVGVPL